MKKKMFALPYIIWMILFTVVPLILVLIYAFVDMTDTGNVVITLDYIKTAFSADNITVLLRSLEYALITTIICLLLSYPAAMFLSKLKSNIGAIICLLFILPMWINFLLRVLALQMILANTGILNGILNFFGLPSQHLLYTRTAILIGMTYDYLPFMILPIYNAMCKIDRDLIHAAADLGAGSKLIFRKIILPLSMPGVISGIIMVFVPSISEFAIADILGGSKILLIGNVIEQEFSLTNNWHLGSGLSIVLMVFIFISMAVMNKNDAEGEGQMIW
mgnify:CR=1 FL=1